jgi:hypothetical protein
MKGFHGLVFGPQKRILGDARSGRDRPPDARWGAGDGEAVCATIAAGLTGANHGGKRWRRVRCEAARKPRNRSRTSRRAQCRNTRSRLLAADITLPLRPRSPERTQGLGAAGASLERGSHLRGWAVRLFEARFHVPGRSHRGAERRLASCVTGHGPLGPRIARTSVQAEKQGPSIATRS